DGLAYSHVLPWVIPAEQVGVRIEPQSSRNGRRPQVTGPGGRLLFAAPCFGQHSFGSTQYLIWVSQRIGGWSPKPAKTRFDSWRPCEAPPLLAYVHANY